MVHAGTFQIRVIEVEALPMENLEVLKSLIKKAFLRKLKEHEAGEHIKEGNAA
jgi:hypothetical protein